MPSVLLLDSCGIASVSALPEFEWFIIIPSPGWKQNLLGQRLPRWALLSCCCEMLFCWSLSGTGSAAATAGSPGCSLNSSGLDRYYPCVLCLGKIGKHCWIRAYKKDSIPCRKSIHLSISAYQIYSNSLHSQKPQPLALGLLPLWNCQRACTYFSVLLIKLPRAQLCSLVLPFWADQRPSETQIWNLGMVTIHTVCFSKLYICVMSDSQDKETNRDLILSALCRLCQSSCC